MYVHVHASVSPQRTVREWGLTPGPNECKSDALRVGAAG